MITKIKAIKESVSERESSKKWGGRAMAAGYIQFPSILLKRQRELGLDSIDINIILHIAVYWWRKDDLPFPSKKTIADALWVDESTIRKRIKALEEVGYVVRHYRKGSNKGNLSNQYDLSGLVAKLEPFAKLELAEREARKTKAGRKSLNLVVKAEALQ